MILNFQQKFNYYIIVSGSFGSETKTFIDNQNYFLSKSIHSFNGINTHSNTKFIKRSQIQKHLSPTDEAFNLLISTVVDKFKATKEGDFL